LLVLFHLGGTEQHGPQNVNGGHYLMGRVIGRTIAEKLGNAIAMRYLGPDPNAPPLKNNGITGDARRASKALG
jgi:creatinine amidohydrolase/Fe(II)-dependent formamide hydrolase-like protein